MLSTHPPKIKYYFERRLLQIFKKFYLSQMNPKEFVHNTAYSVQLPYNAGHSLYSDGTACLGG